MFNIFEPNPVIFRSDNSNLLEHFASIPIDPNKLFQKLDVERYTLCCLQFLPLFVAIHF